MKVKKRNLWLAALAAATALCAAPAIMLVTPAGPALAQTADTDHTHGEGWSLLTVDYLNSSDGSTGKVAGQLPGGNYYLTADTALTDCNITVAAGEQVTLCLNGYTLTGNGSGSVISVAEGATFTLDDCSAAHTGRVTGGSGTLSSQTASPAEGVNITVNTYYGGGIYTAGTVVVNGGSITGNGTAYAADNTNLVITSTYGGGVAVTDTGSFTLNGGEVTANTALYGAGIYSGGTVVVDGGSITANNSEGYGGAIMAATGSATVVSGEIANNGTSGLAVGYANASLNITGGDVDDTVVVDSYDGVETTSTVEVSGGNFSAEAYRSITGYIAAGCTGLTSGPDGATSVVAQADLTGHEHGGQAYTYLSYTGGALADGYYYLASDTALESNITISGTVTLCLNGHTLTGNDSGPVIMVDDGAQLTLCDCSAGGGIVTGGYVYVSSGTLNMHDNATISGNTAIIGGGVYVLRGTLNMHDNATIYGNSAREGGGVYVDSGALNMYDNATIYGNTANSGGGIYAIGAEVTINGGSIHSNTANGQGGAGISISSGTLVLNDGDIYSNTANNSGGGGVNMTDSATFTMNGGSIYQNESKPATWAAACARTAAQPLT